MSDPGQAPTTAPPVLPGQPNQPQGGGYGPTLGGVIPPDPGPGNGTPIVPVPGFTPPVLPGNRLPPGSANPLAPNNPTLPVVPAPADGGQPAPLPVPAAGGEDLVSQLERAARLHEQGLLSDQEFADLKQRLLNPPAIPPQRPQPGTPVSTDTGRGDNRVPALLLTGLTAFLSAGLRRRARDETGTSYSLNDGTVVEFDADGRFITPSWSDPSMGTANSVHIFPEPQVTADNPSLKDKGLPPTIEGGITFPSNPNDQMYLSRVPGPEGDNHNWYVAYTYINPRLDDPGAKDKDGWLPYALIVQDQNGYHQVTDPPAKGSGAAAAMAAGLAMWGFQRPAPGTGGGGRSDGPRVRPGPSGPPKPATITGPKGETIPAVPPGATGTTTPTGKGIEYPIPQGTAGLDAKVTSIRVMDPVSTGKYQYPNGYVVYMNNSGQTVNPLTGRTVSNADPYAHIELPPR